MFKNKRRVMVTVASALVVLLAVGLAVTFTGGGSQASDRQYLATGGWLYKSGHRPTAPDFTGTSLTGTPIRLSSYKDKVLVLNFWSSWCGPCRGEAPTLAVLSEKYAKDGVSFLGDDVGDTPTNASSFTQSMGITYPSMNDPGYQIPQDFGNAVLISAPPTTLVIDRTGHVAGVIYGGATFSELDTMIHDVVSQ